MSGIEMSIEVERSVRTVYNQWTQFQEFPRFMEGVEEVRQVDDTHLHWVVDIGGQRREWVAVVTEQTPDQRIAWSTDDGTRNAGVVTFHRLGDGRTKVMLQLDVEPDGVVERVGDALGVWQRRAEGDLGRFKEFIESRPAESGAWRGTVEQTTT
jgi:uncharacterized membrane protein